MKSFRNKINLLLSSYIKSKKSLVFVVLLVHYPKYFRIGKT